MSSWGDVKPFTVSMASDVTLSTLVDLGQGWGHYAIEIPTMASGTDIYIQGAVTDGGTFRRCYVWGAASTPEKNIASSVTNTFLSLRETKLPRYVKVELSTAMTATPATFKFICWN